MKHPLQSSRETDQRGGQREAVVSVEGLAREGKGIFGMRSLGKSRKKGGVVQGTDAA